MTRPEAIPDNAYVAIAQIGHCKVCGKYEDLRCGACFGCAPKVDGKPDGKGGHILWHIDHPEKQWRIYAQ